MNKLPTSRTLSIDVGVIHFIGIGGIGMSGIAEILHNLGYKVQGSDASESYNLDRLRKLGIKIFVGHKAENVGEAAVVVRSSAIKKDNPELVEARKQRIAVVMRAEMLAELMRLKTCVAVAGTHGKTTTTSLVASMMESVGLNPTVINGGIINALGTNAKLGKGDWLVAEADESDGTFLKLPATVGIITNIDPEHMEHYGSFEAIVAAFENFINNLPFYGFCVMCNDHKVVAELAMKVTDRRVITYAIDNAADLKATNIRTSIEGAVFDVVISDRLHGGARVIKDIKLPMPGIHNVLNSLAAIAVAVELGCSDAEVSKGFSMFQGVKRRFTKTGEVSGITIIDDYGHHPTEIKVTLKTARSIADHNGGRVVAVVQPHRFTRVRDLFAEFSRCFDDADIVVLAPIYSAGEAEIDGIDHKNLADAIKKEGHKQVYIINDELELSKLIKQIAISKDYVVCLGAGSISSWANALPSKLEDEAKVAFK